MEKGIKHRLIFGVILAFLVILIFITGCKSNDASVLKKEFIGTKQDTFIVQTKPKIIYVDDTIIQTRPFIFTIDTIIKIKIPATKYSQEQLRDDTLKIVYEFPENNLVIDYRPPTDSLFNFYNERIVEVEKRYTILEYSLMLVGIVLVVGIVSYYAKKYLFTK